VFRDFNRAFLWIHAAVKCCSLTGSEYKQRAGELLSHQIRFVLFHCRANHTRRIGLSEAAAGGSWHRARFRIQPPSPSQIQSCGGNERFYHSDCSRIPGLEEHQSTKSIPARQITLQGELERAKFCAETKHLRPFSLPCGKELRIDKEPIMESHCILMMCFWSALDHTLVHSYLFKSTTFQQTVNISLDRIS
jgi:hypothetical protein